METEKMQGGSGQATRQRIKLHLPVSWRMKPVVLPYNPTSFRSPSLTWEQFLLEYGTEVFGKLKAETERGDVFHIRDNRSEDKRGTWKLSNQVRYFISSFSFTMQEYNATLVSQQKADAMANRKRSQSRQTSAKAPPVGPTPGTWRQLTSAAQRSGDPDNYSSAASIHSDRLIISSQSSTKSRPQPALSTYGPSRALNLTARHNPNHPAYPIGRSQQTTLSANSSQPMGNATAPQRQLQQSRNLMAQANSGVYSQPSANANVTTRPRTASLSTVVVSSSSVCTTSTAPTIAEQQPTENLSARPRPTSTTTFMGHQRPTGNSAAPVRQTSTAASIPQQQFSRILGAPARSTATSNSVTHQRPTGISGAQPRPIPTFTFMRPNNPTRNYRPSLPARAAGHGMRPPVMAPPRQVAAATIRQPNLAAARSEVNIAVTASKRSLTDLRGIPPPKVAKQIFDNDETHVRSGGTSLSNVGNPEERQATSSRVGLPTVVVDHDMNSMADSVCSQESQDSLSDLIAAGVNVNVDIKRRVFEKWMQNVTNPVLLRVEQELRNLKANNKYLSFAAKFPYTANALHEVFELGKNNGT